MSIEVFLFEFCFSLELVLSFSLVLNLFFLVVFSLGNTPAKVVK